MDYEYPINLSLVRPNLPGGIEMLPLALVITPLEAVGFLCMAYGGYRYGFFLMLAGIVAYFAFRSMAREDPYACRIYMRAMRYQATYAGRPSLHRRMIGASTEQLLQYVKVGAMIGIALTLGLMFL